MSRRFIFGPMEKPLKCNDFKLHGLRVDRIQVQAHEVYVYLGEMPLCASAHPKQTQSLKSPIKEIKSSID